MKTRELTADEVNITLSAEDISKIPKISNPGLPLGRHALEAVKAGLSIRGRAMNLYVCGPSAPERESAVLNAAENMPKGRVVKIKITENPESANEPLVETITSDSDAPVIIENNPVPARLFGIAEGTASAVFTGSLVKSAGGIILLNAEDLLEEEESWKLLKRMLRTGRVEIGAREEIKPGTAALRLPEVELDLKVVILGSETHFDHFYNTDEDFRELFQFFAEFDSVIELDENSLSDSVNHFRNFTAVNLNRSLTDEGALEAIKYSISSAENKTKLSTITSEIEFLLTEAAVIAGEQRDLTGEHLRQAVKSQADRFSLLERRILEDIQTGEINLQVDGSETGKVNGLAIIDKGPWSFGSPGLISARIAPGENGLVNIEHEAGLSGEIHDKWVLILEGFLRSRFAQDFPLSIFASICFEQSYSEIDGDSASSSELYALLSAISGVPLRQDIAVTGSLSQTGGIQAVGGLGEKIEGFYKACRALNYTGNQGVIVPEQNIKNIILPDEIIDEIKAGRFHIYPVSTVDDSMEILTGKDAGERNTRGIFPHGSLNNLIEKNLKKLAAQAKNFGN